MNSDYLIVALIRADTSTRAAQSELHLLTMRRHLQEELFPAFESEPACSPLSGAPLPSNNLHTADVLPGVKRAG